MFYKSKIAVYKVVEALFFVKTPLFCLICAGILSIIAIGDFNISNLSRRTIMFYSRESGDMLIEERFIARKRDKEENVRSFVEEVMLVPVYPGAASLLDRETRLETFFTVTAQRLEGFQ
ncbi:MAG: hypothetical protein LBT01_09135 [Spirochaetaceae bacterium]|nr:hypothetical protein [Spirochaetaceae bacterium]